MSGRLAKHTFDCDNEGMFTDRFMSDLMNRLIHGRSVIGRGET